MKNYTFFDVHSHHMAYPKKQLTTFLENANDMNICVFFMGVDIETYNEIKELSQIFDNIVPCFGIHPQNAYRYYDNLSILDEYIKNAVIVGEIGLDSFWSDSKTRPFQRDVFIYQMKLANKYKKPISIHTTGAELETYKLLKGFDCKNICIHWYHGDLEILKNFISLGCYFSIGPDIGITKNESDIAKTIPINKLLCETDGPDAVSWAQNVKISKWHLSSSPIIDVYDNLSKVLSIEKSSLCSIIKQNVMEFINP